MDPPSEHQLLAYSPVLYLGIVLITFFLFRMTFITSIWNEQICLNAFWDAEGSNLFMIFRAVIFLLILWGVAISVVLLISKRRAQAYLTLLIALVVSFWFYHSTGIASQIAYERGHIQEHEHLENLGYDGRWGHSRFSSVPCVDHVDGLRRVSSG